MPRAWHTVTGDDLWKAVSRSVVEKADEDAEGGTRSKGDFQADLDTRAKKLVEEAVDEVLAAIDRGGRCPLSLTEGAVPPEAVRHVLSIAAYELTSSPPSLMQVLIFDGGTYCPRQKLYAEAKEWVDAVAAGKLIVTKPEDPDEDTEKEPIRFGGATKIDLGTDGPLS